MKLRPVSAAVLLLLSGAIAFAHAAEPRRAYIVQLADKPVASYTGDVAGLAATQPAPGTHLNLDAAPVQLYSDYLVQKQGAVKALVPNAPVLNDYKVVLNGFAAMLTDSEVHTLQANSGVASITPDTEQHLLTNYTPTFLGLDGPSGLWSQTVNGVPVTGENVVIGIVDGGVWPENGAYADRVDANNVPTFDPSGSIAYNAPVGWNGTCATGEGFTVNHCNNKLIGARFYKAGFDATPNTLHWTEFVSPRDSIGGTNVGHGGHGSHTSSTAGGNKGVQATLNGIPMGAVSGMAPRARLAVYKVCWTYNDATDPTGGKNSCWTSDSVAAIEQAVTDGVNVINYSISGGATANDPVEQAFLHAANAGVFVSASGGNDGPGQAVAHISPWLSTVAASTHNRFLKADVGLGNSTTYSGASLNLNPLPAGTPIVRSEDAAMAGANPTSAQLCFSTSWNGGTPVLDPAKVTGKIVTCVRGTNDRVNKSVAVKEAGGVGMVMVDNGSGLVAEVHSVPTVHVTATDGALIKAYAAVPGGTASMSHFVTSVGTAPAPVVAGFSSRGPNAYDGNLLKPDMSAPGVDILAGVTPSLTMAQRADVVNGTLVPPPDWALYQGTSMAAPHVAGVAALLHQQHPTWTPAMIKSALMTSATKTFDDPANQSGNSLSSTPWSQGAGHINPVGTMLHPDAGTAYNPYGASDPGLVYNAGSADYKKYMCGAGITTECSTGAIAGYNLNMPSITLNNVLGTTTVTRTVTNVGAPGTYTATATIGGYNAVVAPASLTLATGQSASFTVSLTRTNSPDNVWQYGKLTWTDGSHIVRSPLTARSGKPITAPSLATSTRGTGNTLLSVSTGFAGHMTTAVGGMKMVTKSASLQVDKAPAGSVDTIAQVQTACNNAAAGVRKIPVTVPANNVMAAFELFDRDTDGQGNDDLDLALLNPAGTLIGYSGHGGSNESIVSTGLAAGTYNVCVIGFAPSNGVSTHFQLSSAVATRGEIAGALRALVPSQVYAGGVATVGASWSGLASGQRYYGGVQYLDLTSTVAATTVLLVETNNPLPVAQGPQHEVKNVGSK